MTELPRLPFDNPDILGIAPQMSALREEGPITRVRTAGEDAWLVTRYDEVRTLLADRRLGLSNPDPARSARKSTARATMMALMAGDDYDTEATRHAQYRALLVPRFSTRRMRMMKDRIEQHVDELLDELAACTPPVDLHRALSFPLPTMVICDLLGVPVADRERFGLWARGTFDQSDNQHSTNTFQLVTDYITELVARKRSEPGDDILSELIAADGTLSDEYIAQLGSAVLLFGYETTIVRIDLGTLLLLRNPAQRARLVENPELAPAAVEEILRLGVGGKGSNALIPRYAHGDIPVGDTVIRCGDAVMLAIGAGNYDGRAYPDSHLFDLSRHKPRSHLAFGHGIRHCIGRTLARIELTAVFERLFRRLPNLRLAVPEESVRWQEHRITGGFDEIPVTF
ncbi:MAG: cytochrome P450 [Actinophytocola sp.]|uniref:pentalenolactone synthase n=1 Tax=Actinophytocola sp. TaxID=1872138 RepID=UPI003C76040E